MDATAGSVLEANVSPWRGDPGNILVAHVVLKPGSPGIDLSNLSVSLAVPQFMRPAAVLPLDQFPVTEHGKRDRWTLANLNINLDQQQIPAEIHLTLAQKRVLSIWEEVAPKQTAGLHQITAESDFFMVGGTSLTLMEVQRRIFEEIGHRVELVQLFESSSLGGMATLIDQQTGAAATDNMRIDWSEETQLGVPTYSTTSQRISLADGKLKVLLTGATGFLGQALLRHLVRDDRVTSVHCVAVRSPDKIGSLQDHPKVQVHRGDLAAPRLGLTEDIAREVFTECNIFVHNGADVSFLKSYQSLRESNVSSTRELIRLTLVHANGVRHFSFVSTAAVAWLSGAPEYEEATARHVQPPNDGSLGYAASKWASERLVEQAVERYGLNATIFRPTNISGPDTSEQDIVHNIVHFSRVLKAIPHTAGLWDGVINFVSLGQCIGEIFGPLWATVDNSSLQYVHLVGPEHIPINNLKKYLEETDKTVGSYNQLDLAQWIVNAEKSGMNTLTATYLKKLAVEKQHIVFTKLLRAK